MEIRPIRTAEDHDWALTEVARYFDDPPVPGSPEADRFDVLSDLIEAYEAKHHPVEELDPVELIRAHLETTGKAQADLAELFGSRSRASEILNRRRSLTIEMVHRLVSQWGLPAEGLVRPYHLERA